MKRVLATMTALFFLGASGAALAATNSTGGENYPICDRSHSDNCMQLGQNASMDRQLLKAHPECQKIKGKLERGACINKAGGGTTE